LSVQLTYLTNVSYIIVEMEISSDLLLLILAIGAFILVGIITSEIFLMLRVKKGLHHGFFPKILPDYD